MNPQAAGRRNEIARALTMRPMQSMQPMPSMQQQPMMQPQQQPMAAPAYAPPAAAAIKPVAYAEPGFGTNEKLTPLEEIGMTLGKLT